MRKLHNRYEYQGLPISIENERGTVRRGVDPDGEPWSTVMQFAYGYIRGTEGVDGDHVDCFIGPSPDSRMVFIIHQRNPETGAYDEDKVFLGFRTVREAQESYRLHYDEPEKFIGPVTVTSITGLKTILKEKKGMKLEKSQGPRLVITGELLKTKYVRRWRGNDGRWHYEYPNDSSGAVRNREKVGGKLTTGVGPKISAKERKTLSSAVREALPKSYYDEIPIDEIDQSLRKQGFLLLQEDDTPWSGMLTGREGRVLFTIGRLNETKDVAGETGYQPIKNAGVSLSWYKDDKRKDSKYDVVGYLS